MTSEYTINWFSNNPKILNSPELQRYVLSTIGSLTASDIKTQVRALPLNEETAPIIAYWCTLLRILALTA